MIMLKRVCTRINKSVYMHSDFTVKGKIVTVLNEVHHHEDVLWSGDIAPCALNLGTGWR
jgi:hypothetical protein